MVPGLGQRDMRTFVQMQQRPSAQQTATPPQQVHKSRVLNQLQSDATAGGSRQANLSPATLHRPSAVVAPLPQCQQYHDQQQPPASSVTKARPPLAPKPQLKPVAAVVAQPNNAYSSANKLLEQHNSEKRTGNSSPVKQPPPPPPKRVTSIRTICSTSAAAVRSAPNSPTRHLRAIPAYENAQQMEAQLKETALAVASPAPPNPSPLAPPPAAVNSTVNHLKTLETEASARKASLPAYVDNFHENSLLKKATATAHLPYPTCDDSHLLAGELAAPLQQQAAQSKNLSNTSVESAFLPFANENVGTIRQRPADRANKPPLTALAFESSGAPVASDADSCPAPPCADGSLLNKLPPPPPVRLDSIKDR